MVTASPDTRYNTLPPGAADMYRRLSILPLPGGNFDSTYAAALTGRPRPDAENILAVLASTSLVESASADESRGAFYRFDDTTRAHAAGRLAQEPPEHRAEVLRRALDYLLDTASRAEHRLTPTHRPLAREYVHPPADPLVFETDAAALAWLEAHRDTLLTAITAADEAGIDSVVWQLTHALWPLLRARHDHDLWDQTHRRALGAARRCQNRTAELEILGTWGVGLRTAGLHADAIEAFDQVLQLAHTHGDPRAEAQALHELGATHLAAKRPQEAESFLLQARSLRTALIHHAEANDDTDSERTFRRAVAVTDVALGQTQLLLGRSGEAVATLSSARATLLTIPDPFDAARAMAWLGRAHALNGDTNQGEQHGRQAITETDQLGTPQGQARSRELLGQTLQEAGRREDARHLYQDAVRLYSPIGRPDRTRVLERLGELATRTEGDSDNEA
ncbi:tetratricopeptide repeat protein [Streptomyces sp. NPDC001508]|uniref:tetratricopeptide repeat protein n=1 Tax=Streptomyces sp. NPDC001508 TaxID=3154656 RepID=UPI0033248A56